MKEKTKSILKVISGIAIGAGAVGWVSLGGTESGAMGIVAGAVVLIGAVSAIIALIKG